MVTPTNQELRTVTDQVRRTVSFVPAPQRIVSLVPSQTEYLFDLGLNQEVVGITKFCIHPKEKFKLTEKIGGTKRFQFDKIERLQPDLILGNKEENYQQGIDRLTARFPVWLSDIITLPDALDMMRAIGDLVGKTERAREIVGRVQRSFTQPIKAPRKRALYFIWRSPYMVAGRDTFIHHMMDMAGFENVMPEGTRYPELTLEDVMALDPEVILLSSEPFPFKPRHAEEIQAVLPDARWEIVDGEMFSWYGSRLLHSRAYFEELRQKV
ncbi:MAG: helical backbone metal receptor [Bacteroidota bacterium]